MRRQKWGVIGLAAMLGIAALGCGEKKTEQDNGMDNPATVINWQEEPRMHRMLCRGRKRCRRNCRNWKNGN